MTGLTRESKSAKPGALEKRWRATALQDASAITGSDSFRMVFYEAQQYRSVT